MKKLLFILTIGFAFSDTIYVTGKKKPIEDAKYIGTKDGFVEYSQWDQLRLVKCSKVSRIVDSNGNEIEFNCSFQAELGKYKKANLKIKSFGALLISIGAVILYYDYSIEEPAPLFLETYKEESRVRSMIGTSVIALGGFLVAIGY